MTQANRRKAEVRRRFLQWAILVVLALVPSRWAVGGPMTVEKEEFIYEEAPFPSCHASTIVESGGKLVAAWFGGTEEKSPDVCIWLSENTEGKWSKPRLVADGIESADQRWPCWNPVLFQPTKGPLLLFYKVGPDPKRWWGEMKSSVDVGRSWTQARRLPDGYVGPVKNKPVELTDGTIFCGSSSEDEGWRVHFEWTKDLGQTWEKSAPVNDGREIAAIQPTLFTQEDEKIMALCRNRKGNILTTSSQELPGKWSGLTETDLPNPNSGLDGLTLRDGRMLLVYNNVRKGRSPISVALASPGEDFTEVLELEREDGAEFSYPAVIQSADGRVHVTYTWKREKIKHVVLKLEP